MELLFAADTAVCAESEGALEVTLNIFILVCDEFGLEMSINKTEVMIQRSFQDVNIRKLRIVINDQTLKEIQQFKYLGAMIPENPEMYKEMDTRMKKAGAVFAKLYGKVWSRHNLSTKTKFVTYSVKILPILLYACYT